MGRVCGASGMGLTPHPCPGYLAIGPLNPPNLISALKSIEIVDKSSGVPLLVFQLKL